MKSIFRSLIIGLMFCSPALAVISRVETVSYANSSGGSGGSSCSDSAGAGPAVVVVPLGTSTTTGELIVVATMGGQNGGAAGTLADNLGQSYNKIFQQFTLAAHEAVQLWYKANSASGVTTLTFTSGVSDTCQFSTEIVTHYTGAAVDPLDVVTSLNSDTVSPITGPAFTTNYANEVLVSIIWAQSGGGVITSTGGWVTQAQLTTSSGDVNRHLYTDQIVSSIQTGATYTGTDPGGSPNDHVLTATFLASGQTGQFFVHQGTTQFTATQTNGVTSQQVNLDSLPIQGDLILAAVNFFSTTITNVKDGNNNTFTIAPHSPVTQASAGSVALYYLVVPSGTPNPSVTVTFPALSSAAVDITADLFHVTNSGMAALDTDASDNTQTGSTINTPSFAPGHASELYYASAMVQTNTTAINSPWIGNANLAPSGDAVEYQLNVNTTQNPNITVGGGSGTWASAMAAFYLTGGVTPPPTIPVRIQVR